MILILIVFQIIYFKYNINEGKNKLTIVGQDVRSKIEKNINLNISSFKGFVYNFDMENDVDKIKFGNLAEEYLTNFSNIMCVTYENKKNITHMFFTKKYKDTDIVSSIKNDNKRKLSFNLKVKDKLIFVRGPFNLNGISDERKFLEVTYPRFSNEEINDIFACIIDLNSFFNTLIPKEISDIYNISISDGRYNFYGNSLHHNEVFSKKIKANKDWWYLTLSSKTNYKLKIFKEIFVITICFIFIVLILLYIEKKIINKNRIIRELTILSKKLKMEILTRKSVEEKLKKSEERYKLAVDGANDVIWEWNIENRKLFISDKWKNISGYTDNEYINIKKLLKDVVCLEDRGRMLKDLRNYINGKSAFYRSEFRIKTKNGSYKWIYNRGKMLKDSTGKIIRMSGSITDITKRKRIEEKIKYLAWHDQLTDIPNKRYFIDVVSKLIQSNKEDNFYAAVLFLDLDNFKKVNDILGHYFGDELLKKVAKILENCIGTKQNIARVGGDEFLIFLPCSSDYSSILEMCLKIINAFSKPIKVENKFVHISTSIGISVFPQDGDNINVLLRNSDVAMYKAKKIGKNTYCFFNKEMDREIKRKCQIEKELRNALQNNEFEIYYQPEINANTEEIVGFEALLRWENKEIGQVSPMEFIPILEDMGLIVDIGEWVIKNVFIQNKNWTDAGFKFDFIAINLSVIQLQSYSFKQRMENLIRDTKVEPKKIQFEITETVLMSYLSENIKLLNHFRKLGLQISLDDFGTGYSSFKYLKDLPVNTLKIDKCFIDNINTINSDKTITEGIIKLAHNINIDVVAEGVETQEQFNILKSIYCDKIQGNYYSKPLPAKDIEKKFYCKIIKN